MKHGLKQEIKRGLSVLMAASMVASSALPVMAEEVVEEAVEVEVVSEEVADAEEELAVGIEDAGEVVEEVVDGEVVVEEAADGSVIEGYEPVGEHTQHTFASIAGLQLYDNNDGVKEQFIVTWNCAECTELQYSNVGTLPTNAYPFGQGGGYENTEWVPVTLGAQTAFVLKSAKYHKSMNCGDNVAGEDVYYVYKASSDYRDYKDDKKEAVYETAVVPVKHKVSGTPIVETKATCTTTGKQTYVCSKCEKTIQGDTIPMKNHTWVQQGNVVWADDASYAYVTFACKTEGSKETQKIDLTPYIYLDESSNTYAPTCGKEGKARYKINVTETALKEAIGLRTNDSISNDSGANTLATVVTALNSTTPKDVTLKAKAHNITNVKFTFGKVAAVDSRPYLDGSKCELTCSGCGVITIAKDSNTGLYAAKDSKGNTVDAYKSTTWNVTVDEETSVKATCGSTGVNYYHATFTFDDKEYDSKDYTTEPSITTSIDADNHSFTANPKVEDAVKGSVKGYVDCTHSAVGSFECKNCGKKVDNVKIPALGHDLVIATTNYKAPKCDSYGIYNAQCSRCQKNIGNGINASLNGREKAAVVVTADKTQKYDTATNTYVADTVNAISDKQLKALLNKNAEHKYVINTAQKPVWTNDNTYCKISVICNCGSNSHTSNLITGKTFASTQVKTVKADPVVEKEATNKTAGSMHYEATFKFTDDFGKEWVFTEKSASMEIPALGGKETATISVADKTVTYNGNRQYVKATTNSDETPVVSYYKDAACTQKFSGAPYTAGTYYVKAIVPACENYTAAESGVATLVIKKADPKVTVTPATKTVKNTKKNTINIKVTQNNIGAQQGKVTYKAASSKIKVNSKGVVTVKKGTKKGTYKVTVTVKATTNYNKYTKTVKITVK